MAKHKHAEIIKQWADDQTKIVEWRHYDSEEWQRVEKPSWLGDVQYRIKPERVYPETRMEGGDLYTAYGDGFYNILTAVGLKNVANAAIKHAVDAGQVMLPGGELADKDIIDAIKSEERKQDCNLSNRAYEIILPAIKSLLVSEPEIKKLEADRSARDMAIAEAVRDACVATISRFINIPGNLIFVPDLAVVIATVK